MAASKEDVLHALLALDAYNRHADANQRKMSEKDGGELSADIGTVVFAGSSDRMELAGTPLEGASSAGFSAAAYDLGSQTAISYRGTDFNFSSASGALEFLKDFGAGWLSSSNAVGPEGISGFGGEYNFQPYYAQQFYELVTGYKIFPTLAEGDQSANAVLLGHSLGGSLAGYIGALTGDTTRIFNEIPYQGMALNTAIDTFISQNIANDVDAVITALGQILQGEEIDVEGFSFTPMVWPDVDNIHSFRMEGEVAGLARLLGPTLGAAASFLVGKRIEALQSAADKFLPDPPDWENAGEVVDELTSLISELCPKVGDGVIRRRFEVA